MILAKFKFKTFFFALQNGHHKMRVFSSNHIYSTFGFFFPFVRNYD